MLTVDALMNVVRACFIWGESCPCHYELLRHPADPKLVHAWEKCPLRGRRLPEVAAGDFMEFLGSTFDKALNTLVQELPPGLTQEQRANLVGDFAQGRAHLMFQFVLKLEAMHEAPRLLFATAHHNRMKARDALRSCLDSSSKHPRIIELQTGELREEAERFLEGEVLEDLHLLGSFVASFAFAFAVERLVEGDHAAIHRAYGKARYHTEVGSSCSVR